MFLSIITILIPLISTIFITYTEFHRFYSSSPVFMAALFILGAIITLAVVLPVKKAHRLLFTVTPFFILYCTLYNFITMTAVAVLTVLCVFLIPRKYKKGRIIFTEESIPVFLTYKLKKTVSNSLSILSGITFFSSLLLFILTCTFTTPTAFWQVRVFPIDLNYKENCGEYVVPSGEVTCSVGYNEAAILVDSFIPVVTEEGTLPSPAQSSGMLEGDVITHINAQPAKLSDFLKTGPDKNLITVTVMRLEEGKANEYTFDITPLYSIEEDKYMIGISYYDAYMISMYSTVQTISFTYPDTGYFAATAHSSEMNMEDYFTNALRSATVMGRDDTGIVAVPGDVLGEIKVANRYGAFGVWEETDTDVLPIAKKDELRLGKATILSDFEGDGVKEYDAIVTGTYRIDSRDVICLIVTDQRIIDAGGVTRGMSGSPVIQNGKIIGALSNTDSNGYCSYASFAYDMAHEIYLAQDELSLHNVEED